jgi:tetratricopeptide (TPR) repeat protein
MAEDLRAEGRNAESRDLLERTLANLERAGELHPRVLVTLHRELAQLDLDRGDDAAARIHLDKTVALAEGDDYLAKERALSLVMLGDLAAAEGEADAALQHYRTAITNFLDVVGHRA